MFDGKIDSGRILKMTCVVNIPGTA